MARLSREDYLEQLVDIHEKLEDFIGLMKIGKLTYIRDISIKLRILYCKRSGTDALIDKIQELYGIEVKVKVVKPIKQTLRENGFDEDFIKTMVISVSNTGFTWFTVGELVNIHDALDALNYDIDGNEYSARHIFAVVADKMGGAHVDDRVPDKHLVPHSNDLLLFGGTVAQNSILDIAKGSVELIDMVKKYIEDGKENEFINERNG